MENTKRKINAENQEEKTMKNINVQNKVNNVKGSRKTAPMIIAAVAALAGAAIMLTGCGTDVPASSLPAADTAVTTSASTTATETTASAAAKNENKTTATSAVNDEQMSSETTAAKVTSPASTATADNIGVDEATAIANVKSLVGSGAQIISSTKGTAPDTGFACWVIAVAPVTNGNGPETVTYYSGYQFCYTFENDDDRNAAASAGNIGVDEATAIANVREQVGSEAEIISCTKGTAPDTGINCYVIVVAPVTNGDDTKTVTYYSGYQFCYTYENDGARNATASDGQN